MSVEGVPLNVQLAYAAEAGNVEEANRLISLGAEVDSLDVRSVSQEEMTRLRDGTDRERLRNCRGGLTPLMRAVQQRNYEVARVLLLHGANPNRRDDTGMPPWGRTALMYAAGNGDTAMIELLIEYHARTALKDKGGFGFDAGDTALHYAATVGHAEAAAVLAKNAKNVDARNDSGETALLLAVCARSLPTVTVLLSAGANPNLKETDLGNAPLHIAAYDRELEMVQKLIRAGADVNALNDEGTAVFLEAIYHDGIEIVEELLRAGAQIPIRALKVAMKHNAHKIAKLLRKTKRPDRLGP